MEYFSKLTSIQVHEAWNIDSDHSSILLTLRDIIIKKKAPRSVNGLKDWQNFRLTKEINILTR